MGGIKGFKHLRGLGFWVRDSILGLQGFRTLEDFRDVAFENASIFMNHCVEDLSSKRGFEFQFTWR